jgi:alcohol dehydrogenase
MYTKGICFQTGRVHARSAMTRALDLVRAGRLHPELITGQVVGWEDAPDAVAAHESKLVVSRAS